MRLGNLKDGLEEIKKHAFFAGADWEQLQHREATPPWKPALSSAADSSAFAEVDVEEEAEMEANDIDLIQTEVTAEHEALFKDF